MGDDLGAHALIIGAWIAAMVFIAVKGSGISAGLVIAVVFALGVYFLFVLPRIESRPGPNGDQSDQAADPRE